MAWISRIEKSLPVWGWSSSDLAARIRLWRHRARSRRQLLWLDERQLRDIGLDRLTVREEAYKPFWRG
jgi:uncharacterized protein YjiS (DUF1127 family)